MITGWQTGLRAQDFTRLRGLQRTQAGARGQNCAAGLVDGGVWPVLSGYGACIAGTIPLGLGLPASDIDILVNTDDLNGFATVCTGRFSHFDGFHIYNRAATRHVGAAVVVQFMISCPNQKPEQVEIFATNKPAHHQYGFRHMVVEARILDMLDAEFHNRIIALKQAGVKTEPAFARILKIAGDPYTGLDALFDFSPSQLKQRLLWGAVNGGSSPSNFT